MSDLLLTARTPTLATGAGLRTYGVTAALARDHGVEVAYVVWGADHPAREFYDLDRVTMRALPSSRGPARLAEYVRARARSVPRTLARGVVPALARSARAAPSEVRLIADGPVVAGALLALARRRRIVYLAHNLESSGFRMEWEQAGLERFEREMLRTYSECWMATRADQRGARALAGDDIATRYVPNVVDVARIEPIRLSGGSGAAAPVRPPGAGRLLFVADFNYPPNAEALAFLTDAVLPLLWERLPGVRVTAAGRGAPAGLRDPRIETPGFVEDLDGCYRAADVVLVPLLRGGGSPLKFAEGLAYGLPVVASAHAAALLEHGVPGRDFLAADGAEDFAAAIEALLRDPVRAGAVGAAGRGLVERSYSVDALATLLRA